MQRAPWLGLLALTLGCNEVPVASLDKSFSMSVTIDASYQSAVPIDFLWVIDNTTSMCEEQTALGASFDAFRKALEDSRAIDPRVAVVTANMTCPPEDSEGRSMGRFNQKAATKLDTCYPRHPVSCGEHVTCQTWGGAEGWECDVPGPTGTCQKTLNCTIASTCEFTCKTDADCKSQYGDAYVCLNGPKKCTVPQNTQDCPDPLPLFLDAKSLDLFRCSASVGLNQEKCATLGPEEGLKAAWQALRRDADAPNKEQAKSFLRDDAYLVVIFVSDEDDCSQAPGQPGVSEDQKPRCSIGVAAKRIGVPFCEVSPWARSGDAKCGDLEKPEYVQCLPATLYSPRTKDLTDGGSLEPVHYYINRFKTLKPDPSRVLVAVVAGDSDAEDPAVKATKRLHYVLGRGNPFTCHQYSKICTSPTGQMGWGSRYQELVEGFGVNGVFANLCEATEEAAALAPALKAIAARIASVTNKVCLPKPVAAGVALKVVRVGLDGKAANLEKGKGFEVIEEGADCARNGKALPALVFDPPPKRGEGFTIEYQGDPFGP